MMMSSGSVEENEERIKNGEKNERNEKRNKNYEYYVITGKRIVPPKE
jgi:hypothetical protein